MLGGGDRSHIQGPMDCGGQTIPVPRSGLGFGRPRCRTKVVRNSRHPVHLQKKKKANVEPRNEIKQESESLPTTKSPPKGPIEEQRPMRT